MPKVVKQFPNPAQEAYDALFDGRIWYVSDADIRRFKMVNAKTFANRFYQHAYPRGKRATIRFNGSGVYVQVVPLAAKQKVVDLPPKNIRAPRVERHSS